MILDSISIVNYKNIEHADLPFSPKVNCFVGNNGVGKTNILDAIYYLSFCKSALNSVDSQNIRHDADFFVLQGSYANEENARENIYCGFKKQHKKVFKRNGKEYPKLSEHIGKIPLVMVSPNDIDMILGTSEERRRFLDMVISQYDSDYLYEEIRYRKALKQRNVLLKQENPVDEDFILGFEIIMAEAGEKIYRKRKDFLETFIPIFQKEFCQLADEREEVSFSYKTNWEEGDMLQVFQRNRQKDTIVGFSLCGVHRDDLEMSLNGYKIRAEGSQGQTKTYLVALKLAQFEFIRQKKNSVPILLLDDIFDKLDASRVEKILSLVSQDAFGQIFITDTNRNYISDIIDKTGIEARIFNVNDGEVACEAH